MEVLVLNNYGEALEYLMHAGMPKPHAKALLWAQMFGMTAEKFFTLVYADIAYGIADYYRPENVWPIDTH
jgi:hypothetical protein